MENKMYAKPQYKCAICGEIYDDVKTRMECEAKCLKQQEIEAKKAAETKKKEEKQASSAEITKTIDYLYGMIKKHIETYGSYTYDGTQEDLKMYNIAMRPNRSWFTWF